MTATLPFAGRIVLVHEALDASGVGHGFGGAVALAYYVAEPRATRDIDINIHVAVTQAEQVLRAMPEGIAVGADDVVSILESGQVRLWWDGRDGIPVDLFFPQHAFHAEVARDTTAKPFLDTEIPVISATHLTVFKCMFDRSRDWPDIEAMLGARTVDVDRALDWLDRILGPGSAQSDRLSALAAALA